jgi:hypothetical protein
MGQQSNKVQKRRRRHNYLKRKKLAGKATAAVTKPTASAKTPAKKAAESTAVSSEA